MSKLKIKPLAAACLMATVASTSACAANTKPSSTEQNKVKKPNIIVIMTDDQGQWALGASGLKAIATPNLDYLADQGVRFSNGMTPAPVSSAARASFNTGKMPSQHGVYDFLSDEFEDTEWLKGEVLLSERLKKQGYTTGLFGKWHATEAGLEPVRGFDRWLSHDGKGAGWKNKYLHSGNVNYSDQGKSIWKEGVQARYLTKEAVQFIDDNPDKPFYINLNYVEPHAPFEGMPERIVAKYRDIARTVIRDGATSDLKAKSKGTIVPADHEEKLAQYLAGISLVDDAVGNILDALQGRNLIDNTVIAFVSDHGMLMGQYGLYGKTNASAPFANFYEETIRIPYIVYGPDSIVRPKQVRNEFVDLLDLNATILDIASNGEAISTGGPGKSLTSLLKGNRDINWKQYQISERGNARMISNGNWKLVRYYKERYGADPIDRWYDLSSPMGEQYDTEPPRKALKEKMEKELDQFFDKYTEKDHDGRRIWKLPLPNRGSQAALDYQMWD